MQHNFPDIAHRCFEHSKKQDSQTEVFVGFSKYLADQKQL